VAVDPERVARFEREAKTLATLNHPNIAQIHGLERSSGTLALVMELVEGPTLADRIRQSAIPVDEALSLAKQTADALEAAHEQGIVHRDLKPANIKVRPDGTVKVLDFGLAKAMEPAGASRADATNSPTLSMQATMAGVILGTAAYMSPEQARGKPVDKRTDIWAFGCVLYEMLTGKRAFEGDEVSDVLASVLAREPDWTALPRDFSPVLGTVLRRCLHKDRKQRIRDIGDVSLALTGAFDTMPDVAHAVGAGRSLWRRAISVAPAFVLGGLLVGLIGRSGAPAEEPGPVSRFDHYIPSDQTFRSNGRTVLTIAPDGRHFVYNTERGLYLRSMGALEAQLIPGTETRPGHEDLQVPAGPFLAPGGEAVAYFEGGQLKRIDIRGGTPFVICAAEPSFGASWEADNTILFGQSSGIMPTPRRQCSTRQGR
jgi:hypothetical protein